MPWVMLYAAVGLILALLFVGPPFYPAGRQFGVLRLSMAWQMALVILVVAALWPFFVAAFCCVVIGTWWSP